MNLPHRVKKKKKSADYSSNQKGMKRRKPGENTAWTKEIILAASLSPQKASAICIRIAEGLRQTLVGLIWTSISTQLTCHDGPRNRGSRLTKAPKGLDNRWAQHAALYRKSGGPASAFLPDSWMFPRNPPTSCWAGQGWWLLTA